MKVGATGACDAIATARKIADALRSETFSVSVAVDRSVASVPIDPAALEAILTTLLDNSRQAGASQATIAVRSAERVEITVTDDGGSTGLGLPIARSLIAASGGELRLPTRERGLPSL